jgi:LPS export ABC transporter protein LptC
MAAAAAIASGCGERSPAPVLPAQPGGDIPDQESWDATITFTDSGRVTGILRSGYIGKYIEDRYTILDSGLTVDFFNDRYEHTSVLTAARGRVDDATNDFAAWENVVVRSDSGTVLRTGELHWDNRRERIHTGAYVEIVSPTEEIRGIGLESDQSLTHYTILRVTGRVRPE